MADQRRHGDMYDRQGPFTLDEFVFFVRRGYCLVCETIIHGEECLCTGFRNEEGEEI